MRDVVVRRTNDMHPQWCVRNGPLSRITFAKYTAFALLDSADPKRTGVRIVVVLPSNLRVGFQS
jgi:hypothetical protein